MQSSPPNATLRSPSGHLTFAPRAGNIASLTFTYEGRHLSPLHRAPWADDPDPGGSSPPVEQHLSGDFFCAAFGRNDVEAAPLHGWTANSPWTRLPAERGLRYALQRQVMGADIEKQLWLGEDAPLLYQRHTIRGGSGALPVAHHPMIHAVAGARLFLSPKQLALTPNAPLEPGRSALLYPARSAYPHAFPGPEGPVDLTRLPIGRGTEDFVVMVEGTGCFPGWSAVLREAEDDIVFVLKDPAVLPVTMFWHSNAGRDSAPWSGRHDRVIGIEDGCAEGAGGHAAALGPNPVVALGQPTALPLGASACHQIGHVLGAVPRPPGWTSVDAIAIERDTLTLTGTGGARCHLRFDPSVFATETSDGHSVPTLT